MYSLKYGIVLCYLRTTSLFIQPFCADQNFIFVSRSPFADNFYELSSLRGPVGPLSQNKAAAEEGRGPSRIHRRAASLSLITRRRLLRPQSPPSYSSGIYSATLRATFPSSALPLKTPNLAPLQAPAPGILSIDSRTAASTLSVRRPEPFHLRDVTPRTRRVLPSRIPPLGSRSRGSRPFLPAAAAVAYLGRLVLFFAATVICSLSGPSPSLQILAPSNRFHERPERPHYPRLLFSSRLYYSSQRPLSLRKAAAAAEEDLRQVRSTSMALPLSQGQASFIQSSDSSRQMGNTRGRGWTECNVCGGAGWTSFSSQQPPSSPVAALHSRPRLPLRRSEPGSFTRLGFSPASRGSGSSRVSAPRPKTPPPSTSIECPAGGEPILIFLQKLESVYPKLTLEQGVRTHHILDGAPGAILHDSRFQYPGRCEVPRGTCDIDSMHAAIERNSWRVPPEDIVQVADPRTKNQELVVSEPEEGRNWMSIILSLLVISAVISGIVSAIYTLGYVDELLYWSGKRMSLIEALRGELTPQKLEPSWVTSDHFMFQADDGGLSVYTVSTDTVSHLVSNHTITQLNVKWTQASADLKYVLLRHNIKRPGTENPTAELWLTNLSDPGAPPIMLKPPQIFVDKEYYLTSANWVNESNDTVAAVWLNRPQNVSIISICTAPEWSCIESHAERAAENGWVSIKGHPVFSADGFSFLLLSRIQAGDSGRYTHIKHVTLSEEQRISVLSHGRYHVTQILAWDYINNMVYYLGTEPKNAGQRHLYVVKNTPENRSNSSPLTKASPQCITCGAVKLKYENCTHFTAYLPPPPYTRVSRYIIVCEGPGLPIAGVHTWSNHTLVLANLFSSRPTLAPKLASLALPLIKTVHVPLSHGAGRAAAQLHLPPSWREELRDAAFPVLVEVNGIPGKPLVSTKFSIDWGTYMSSQFDVVYIKVDVVDEGSKFVNTRTDGFQIQDYISVIKSLLETFKFLDQTRIAVWGKGYGGYVTTMILSSQHHIVKCGIAIAPVTDWLYYTFTERLLGLPSENYKEFVEADAVQRCKHIEPDSLFLIHGMADISVPYIHSLSLAKALTNQGILFRYQSYSDEGHELSGVLEHLYLSMENYLSSCLSLDKNEQVTQ
ncbi:unnamed protein product [Nesidiocoris tenuis]|uniref:Peptidase S9 prolyl oligopeptidase catalytic domain-containing protein n=1 Tax=Nesidiocoris tenuis TaxID=355587 RepID=A0A6H5HML9_9HEMI|nr:unnamed protein product [Nesidiocoris tenuis]